MSGITAYESKTMGVWDATRGVYRQNQRQRKGIADITACVPPNGKYLAVEIKIGRDSQSPDQRNFQQDVEAVGGTYLLIRDTVDTLVGWLKGEKPVAVPQAASLKQEPSMESHSRFQ